MSLYPKHLNYSNIIFQMTVLGTDQNLFTHYYAWINMVMNLYLACIFIVLQSEMGDRLKESFSYFFREKSVIYYWLPL